MSSAPLLRRLVVALAPALAFTSCGGGDEPAPTVQAGPRAEEPRSADPRLARAREALATGSLETARTLAEQVGASAGVEGPLCRARALFLGGDAVAALAAVEEARDLGPGDSRVYATAAEFLALGRRGVDAEDELAAGLERAGATPDLARARAVLALTRPGQGAVALALLEDALAQDPALPYTAWPLSQANLLTGRLVLGTGDAETALDHAERALALDPDLAEARELAGDALVTGGDLVAAIAAYEAAAEGGLDVARALADAHLRAGMFARVDGRHRDAEQHYLAARGHGLSDEELGSAADYLGERADAAHAAGVAADLRGEPGPAAAEQARALELDPGHGGARHELARLRFEAGDHLGAAHLWGELVAAEAALAGEGGSHLNQARALVLAGRARQAREALEGYLAAWPAGTWAAETRDMLARLP